MIEITKKELNGFLKVLIGIAVLALVGLVLVGLWQIRSLFFWLVVALIIVFLTRPMVDFLSSGNLKIAKHKSLKFKLPRILSIVIVYLVLMTIMFWIVFPAVQILVEQVGDLTQTIQEIEWGDVKSSLEGFIVGLAQPGAVNGEATKALSRAYEGSTMSLEKLIKNSEETVANDTLVKWNGVLDRLKYEQLRYSPATSITDAIDSAIDNLTQWISGFASTLISGIVDFAATVAGLVFQMFIILIIATFLLLDWDLVNAALFSLFSSQTGKTIKGVFANVYEKIWAYVRAQSLLSLTTGTLVGVFCAILGLPSALIIGIIVALGEMVPYVGPIFSFSIGLLLAIATAVSTGSFWTVAWFAIGFIVIEQGIAQTVATPLFAKTTQTHPLVVLFVMFSITMLFGPLAILLAIPFLVFIKAVIEKFVKEGNVFSRFGIAIDSYSSSVPSVQNSALLKRLRKPFTRKKTEND